MTDPNADATTTTAPVTDADATVDTDTTPTDSDASDTDTDALGDAGKRALDAMKAERNAARREAREARKALEDAAATTEAEKAAREVERAALAKANTRIVSAELRREAKGKLADPDDALAFLTITDFEVDDDGNVDAAAIADAIDELLARKPHLGVQDAKPTVKPDASQGATAGTKADLGQQFAAVFGGSL